MRQKRAPAAVARYGQIRAYGRLPATIRAYVRAREVNPNFGQPAIRTEEERKVLFGQTAAVVR